MGADVTLSAVNLVLKIIRDEAQLLGRVRGDVQFITDEMESMNGLLRQLVVSKGTVGDYRFRTWLKQIMELAFDSKNCVERYMQSRQDAGRLWRQIPCRVADMHSVAIEIREIKTRAREIGERQARYGVSMPPPPDRIVEPNQANEQQLGGQGGRERFADASDDSRRAVLYAQVDILQEGTKELFRWLDEPDIGVRAVRPGLSVVAILAPDGAGGATLGDKVYEHYKQQPSDAGQFEFDCKLSIAIRRPPNLSGFEILLDMLLKLRSEKYVPSMEEEEEVKTWDEARIQVKLQDFLRSKKLLLVLSGLDYPVLWDEVKRVLYSFDCSAGSVLVFSTKDSEVARKCSPTKTIFYSHVDFYFKKVFSLVPNEYRDDWRLQGIKDILKKCDLDDLCSNAFLRALCRNPNMTRQDLESLSQRLDQAQHSSTLMEDKKVEFCYNLLPSTYKNCLWYSAFFARGSDDRPNVRRASLVRRWVAQGLITEAADRSALDEAESCFDSLLTQKLVIPRAFGGAGRIKTYEVHHSVFRIIDVESSSIEDLVLDKQLPLENLGLIFSIRDGIQLHRSSNVMEFLKSPPTFSRLLLTVLDLEGRNGFKMRHLMTICKISKLRYLNLRKTDVAQLPKEMNWLRELETLDIRETKVKAFRAVLPKLKHLLAGFIDCSEDTVKSKESFSTVHMPRGVASATMEKLEILSHVKVSNSAKQLINVGDKLEKLRKLGVVLSGKKAKLQYLFLQIDKLHKSLRSLSIRMETPGNWDGIDAILLRPPKLLESLNICGIRSGLLPRIKELHQLAKITLRNTFLKEDALTTLGKLSGLRCLRLRYHSFAEGALTFGNGQFSSLTDLVIEDDIVTSITFASGTAPKLDKMAWSFTRMVYLSGFQNLLSLRHLELNRRICKPERLEELRRDIKEHPNRDVLKLNPREDGQVLGDAGAAALATYEISLLLRTME